MWWKSLLVALLVLPPVSYVTATLYAPTDAPEQRPALVIADVSTGPSSAEPRTTLEPRTQPPRPSTGGGDDPDDDRDDRDDDEDVTVVRPLPQDSDDDDGDDDDDSDDGDDG